MPKLSKTTWAFLIVLKQKSFISLLIISKSEALRIIDKTKY